MNYFLELLRPTIGGQAAEVQNGRGAEHIRMFGWKRGGRQGVHERQVQGGHRGLFDALSPHGGRAWCVEWRRCVRFTLSILI